MSVRFYKGVHALHKSYPPGSLKHGVLPFFQGQSDGMKLGTPGCFMDDVHTLKLSFIMCRALESNKIVSD